MELRDERRRHLIAGCLRTCMQQCSRLKASRGHNVCGGMRWQRVVQPDADHGLQRASGLTFYVDKNTRQLVTIDNNIIRPLQLRIAHTCRPNRAQDSYACDQPETGQLRRRRVKTPGDRHTDTVSRSREPRSPAPAASATLKLGETRPALPGLDSVFSEQTIVG